MPDRGVTCHACGRVRVFADVVPRAATCEGCGENLRCCRTCRFYEQSSYNECAEPSAERVVDKSAATFCDFYDPADHTASVDGASGDSGALSELERLFGKK
jgi:hypothetical protein